MRIWVGEMVQCAKMLTIKPGDLSSISMSFPRISACAHTTHKQSKQASKQTKTYQRKKKIKFVPKWWLIRLVKTLTMPSIQSSACEAVGDGRWLSRAARRPAGQHTGYRPALTAHHDVRYTQLSHTLHETLHLISVYTCRNVTVTMLCPPPNTHIREHAPDLIQTDLTGMQLLSSCTPQTSWTGPFLRLLSGALCVQTGEEMIKEAEPSKLQSDFGCLGHRQNPTTVIKSSHQSNVKNEF